MQESSNFPFFPIFWFPPTLQSGRSATPDPQYIPIIEQYFADVGGSALYEVNTEYFQTVNGPVEFITNSSDQVLAVVDTSPIPGCGGCMQWDRRRLPE